MKIVIPPIYEKLDMTKDPFELDSFNRKTFADNLTRLFRNTSDGFVITINSEWGGGKTTFLHLWEKQLLIGNEFIPIYYDAFENDFAGDAFLSLAVTIHNSLEIELKKSNPSHRAEDLIDKLKNAAISLSKDLFLMSVRSSILSISGGLFSENRLYNSIVSAIVNRLKKNCESDHEKRFKSYIESKNSLKKYQNELSKILRVGVAKKKIVFFIDELDRCRPNFAVEILEKLKHLFNIDNVFFVLAINRDQLLDIISNIYGLTTGGASKYLEKFIHIETYLPAIDSAKIPGDSSDIEAHVNRLVSDFHLSDSIKNRIQFSKDISTLFSKKYLNLNPREMERIFSYISIFIASYGNDIDENTFLICYIMASLKISRPDFYEIWNSGEFNTDNPKEDTVWKWINEKTKQFSVKNSNTVFKIEETPSVCSLLDIYRFPDQENSAKFSEKLKIKTVRI